MPVSTILRVKRKLSDPPINALKIARLADSTANLTPKSATLSATQSKNVDELRKLVTANCSEYSTPVKSSVKTKSEVLLKSCTPKKPMLNPSSDLSVVDLIASPTNKQLSTKPSIAEDEVYDIFVLSNSNQQESDGVFSSQFYAIYSDPMLSSDPHKDAIFDCDVPRVVLGVEQSTGDPSRDDDHDSNDEFNPDFEYPEKEDEDDNDDEDKEFDSDLYVSGFGEDDLGVNLLADLMDKVTMIGGEYSANDNRQAPYYNDDDDGSDSLEGFGFNNPSKNDELSFYGAENADFGKMDRLENRHASNLRSRRGRSKRAEASDEDSSEEEEEDNEGTSRTFKVLLAHRKELEKQMRGY